MLEELRSHPQLILEVVSYSHRINGAVAQHKAVARLVDGSTLHINEVWSEGELRKYGLLSGHTHGRCRPGLG